jgi:tetratricopeptide (TPR) repeat protein
MKIAQYLEDHGSRDNAALEYERLLLLAADLGNTDVQIVAAESLAVLSWDESDTRSTRTFLRFAGEQLVDGTDRESRVMGQLWLARVQQIEGDLPGAVRTAQRALSDARELDSTRLILGALQDLAGYYETAGELARCCDTKDELADLLEADGQILASADAHRSSGTIASNNRMYVRALLSLLSAIELYRFAGSPASAAEVLFRAGVVRAKMDDLSGARSDLEQAVAEFEALGDASGAGHALTELGYVLELTGDTRQSISSFEQALAMATEQGGFDAITKNQYALARLYLGTDEPQKAASLLRSAVAGYADRGELLLEGDALADLAYALSESGDVAGARGAYLRAIERYASTDDRASEGLALVNLGRVEARSGDLEPGLARMERGCSVLCEAGHAGCATRLRAWLSVARVAGQRESARNAADALAVRGETARERLLAGAIYSRLSHPLEVGGHGVVATEVGEGSSGESAGLVPGDVIVRYDGAPVDEVKAFVQAVAQTAGGEDVGVGVLRGDEHLQLVAAGGRLGVMVSNLP